MKEYGLIAIDVDGTLLNSALELTEGNRAALRRAHEAGKHVVLCTGRCMSELRHVLKEIPQVRYLICENGGCVYDLKYDRSIHADSLPPEEVMHVLNCVQDERVAVQAFHENASYFWRSDDSWLEACAVSQYRETFRRYAIFDERFFDTYAERPFQVEKINLYFESPQDRRRIHEKLSDRPVKLCDSMGYMLEVVSRLADKGRGLNMLCSHLGMDADAAIAIGDSMNDIESLQAAGLGVAMGNADEAVKAAADIIAPDCDHDGVAYIIDRYLLRA